MPLVFYFNLPNKSSIPIDPMETKKHKILLFLKEIAIVVIGVLIAAFLNQMKENNDNRAYIQKTLTTIKHEIEKSQYEVDTVLQKHMRFGEGIMANIDSTDISLGSLVSTLGGIQFVKPSNIGLRFFITNKAELIEYETIVQLSDIEMSSEILENKMNALINFNYENIEETDRKSKMKLLAYLSNVVDSEQTLLTKYRRFLEHEK